MINLSLAALAALVVWLLVCLAFWAGFASAGRALPRPPGRHRRDDWQYDHGDVEPPSAVPPNWHRITTKPLPVVTR